MKHSPKEYSNYDLIQLVMNKAVYFTADCQFFPKDGIKGIVKGYRLGKGAELIFNIDIGSRTVSVGMNTDGMMFEFV